MDIRGKAAIVTGSAMGLGAAVALKLARRGVNVVINYSKSEKDAREVAGQCAALGVETLAVKANIAEDADCRRLAAETLDKWGRIDILVNNAGTSVFADHRDLEALTAADFHKIYDLNVVGAYQMIRAAAPAMGADEARTDRIDPDFRRERARQRQGHGIQRAF